MGAKALPGMQCFQVNLWIGVNDGTRDWSLDLILNNIHLMNGPEGNS